MRTFEFASPRGRLGKLIAGPENPPTWYWSGRGDCPDEIRRALTEGIMDPETHRRVAGDKLQDFIEVLEYQYAKGPHMVGRRGRNIDELPSDARSVRYTPGVSGIFD